MKNWIKATSLIKAVALMALFSVGVASAQQTVSKSYNISEMEAKLKMNIETVADSPIDGVLQMVTNHGLLYVTEDLNYVMSARIFNVSEGMRDETEAAMSTVRIKGLGAFGADFIEFKAKNEKHAITVFTDITCGYCRKLHNEIADYNDAGITVRYLAFPRGGLGSKSYDDLVSIWCAEDRLDAMTKAKASGKVAEAKTCESGVEEQFKFAQTIGVNSTPAIIFDDGTLQPGYRPAAAMAQILAVN